MLDKLREDGVQTYIRKNINEDIPKLALQKSPFPDIPMRIIAQQVFGLQKAKKKLLTWFNKEGILYPPKLNLEQTSSECTANYKATLIKDNTIADLTGGFGVDAYFLSKQASRLDYFEKNEVIYAFAKANFQTFDATTVHCQLGDGIEALKKANPFYDAIYIDPSRRHDIKGKVFRLEDCEPNVIEHLDFLMQHCSNLWIKTAPLLDISLGLQALKYVDELHIVAVKNELKELLWKVSKKETATKNPHITVANLGLAKSSILTFQKEQSNQETRIYSKPLTYLYEPNAALMKSGAFNWITNHFQLKKLHPNSHLYTSTTLIDFPGRRFSINAVYPYAPKQLKKLKIKRANITVRNFKETVSQLRKRFTIRDGDDRYLFFTTTTGDKLMVLDCEKVAD